MIVIVDYGTCNVLSMKNMLRKAGERDIVITDKPEVVEDAERIVLPGVGSFDAGMKALKALGLESALRQAYSKGTPMLGVCLGMQLLGKGSEEGDSQGLGFIDLCCAKFQSNEANGNIKIPHMGWDYVDIKTPDSPIVASDFIGVGRAPRFYFVHSYYAICANANEVIMTCNYGGQVFAAAVQHGNAAGVQFHPEKSHYFGLALIRSFLKRTKR